MSGKRLLDAFSLLKASRNVLFNHFAIRLTQLELFTKTSSLFKTVGSTNHPFSQSTFSGTSIPRSQNVTTGKPSVGVRQDHFYNRADQSSVESSAAEINVQQVEAESDPLPDGTIPSRSDDAAQDVETEYSRQKAKNPNPIDKDGVEPVSSSKSTIPTPKSNPLSSEDRRILQRQSEDQIPSQTAEPPSDEPEFSVDQEKDVYYQPPGETRPILSSLPRVRVPKLENDIQGGDPHISKDINSDVYYSGSEEPTEEQLSQLFHTPRAAKLLGKSARRTFSTSSRSHVSNREEMKQLGQEISNNYQMKESRVPSSQIGRLFEYGGLAASMAWGRLNSSSEGISAANMERLVNKLSRMRGAALKLGQMISFQDMKMLPPTIVEILQRVQDNADYMPASQRNQVIEGDLGPDWMNEFQSFEEKPIAAASIGQVHEAILKSGQKVAVKVQYPGVSQSISSDLNNLSLLLTASKLLPKGLYLDKTIANARTELAWECDYIREAEAAKKFKQLLSDEKSMTVPEIHDHVSGKQVLTMERMEGIAVTKIKIFTQEQKDWIGTQIMRLCLREIFEFKYMQTDPNWTNFLYNDKTQQLELLDFGASREFPEEFINLYIRNLLAASKNDRKSCQELSVQLGYLTGYESKAMTNAHIDSVMILAEPFMESAPDIYDFKDQTITDRVRELIPVMLRERLAPPPEETYSLHRKLSGAYLLCARMGSRVKGKELFQNAVKKIGLGD